jgi:uncharacterized tellurite resistance protein B-like protein
MSKELDREDRLRLVRFLCSFAWADLRVHERERTFIRKMVKKLSLDEDEVKAAEKWLKVPPRPEEVDPAEIPHEHRKLFLDAARAVVLADGVVNPDERINLELLEELLQ